MALSIKNDEADRKVRGPVDVVTPLGERLLRLGECCASAGVLDERAPDEILGYDEEGLPT